MTLSELLQLIRRNLGILVTLPVAFALVCAIVFWGFVPDQYSATTSFYVLAKGTGLTQSENDGFLTNSELATSQQLANDIAVLLASKSVINSAAQAADLTNLDNYHTSIESNANNRIITLKVIGPDPVAVARIANALAIETSNVARQITDLDSVKIDNLFFLSSEPNIPNPTDILGSKRFSALIRQLENSFDLIIIDTPPLDRFVDAALTSHVCDGTLLIVSEKKTKLEAVEAAITQLNAANARILGSVFVHNSADKSGHGYGYRHRSE